MRGIIAQHITRPTHQVGAPWAEGIGPTGVHVCGVQKLQHADKIWTIHLTKKQKHSRSQASCKTDAK